MTPWRASFRRAPNGLHVVTKLWALGERCTGKLRGGRAIFWGGAWIPGNKSCPLPKWLQNCTRTKKLKSANEHPWLRAWRPLPDGGDSDTSESRVVKQPLVHSICRCALVCISALKQRLYFFFARFFCSTTPSLQLPPPPWSVFSTFALLKRIFLNKKRFARHWQYESEEFILAHAHWSESELQVAEWSSYFPRRASFLFSLSTQIPERKVSLRLRHR